MSAPAWRRVPRANYDRLVALALDAGLLRGPDAHELRLMDYVQVCEQARHERKRRPRALRFASRWGVSTATVSRWLGSSLDDIAATASAFKVPVAACLVVCVACASHLQCACKARAEPVQEEAEEEPEHSIQNAEEMQGSCNADATRMQEECVHARRANTETRDPRPEKNNNAADAAGLSGVQQQPPKKPTDLDRVNELLATHHPASKGYAKTSAVGKAISARIREHGADAVMQVITWAHESSHDRARFLRDRGLSIATLMRPENCQTYLDYSREGSAGTPRVESSTDRDERRQQVIRQHYEVYLADPTRAHDPPLQMDAWVAWVREQPARTRGRR